MKLKRHKSCRHVESAEFVRAGFTLVELLLTLAVLITIAGMAIVPLAKWQQSMPLDQSVALLQQELSKTRLLAIEAAELYSITFDGNSNSFTRTNASSGEDTETQTFRLMEGVRFVVPNNSTGSTRQLMFQSDGTVSDGIVVLEDTSGTRSGLRLERLTGMVRLADANSIAGGSGA